MKFETSNRSWWAQVTESVRAFPADLVGILGLLALVNVVFRIPGLIDITIGTARVQTLIGIPILLFVPGYVLVAVLFPGSAGYAERQQDDRSARDVRSLGSIDFVERIALSFGMSVALIPIVGLVIAIGWEFSLDVILTGLTMVVLGGVTIAALARLRLPPDDRFRIPTHRQAMDFRRGLFVNNSVFDSVTNIVLVLAIIAAVSAAGYAVATPYAGDASSTFYLMTENETGVQVATDYPTEFVIGESHPLIVGVENDDDTSQSYTVVTTIERVETEGGDVRITERAELERVQQEISAGDSWTYRHEVRPNLIGEDLRLHYYLFEGDAPPAEPDFSTADQDVYIWIDVAS